MSNYFNSRGQTAGFVTLMLAFLFAAAWWRSYFIVDQFKIFEFQRETTVFSSRGKLMCWSWVTTSEYVESINARTPYHFWGSKPVDEGNHVDKVPFSQRLRAFYQKPFTLRFSIPYWLIVPALTILSVYLLLSEPRRCESG